MASTISRAVYCFDTSSFVTIQRTYRRSVFPGLWESIGELATDGRLASPREVLRELERGAADEIYKWARNHESVFRDLDIEQAKVVKEIVNSPKYSALFDVDRETPEADPFVIALAVVENRKNRMAPERWVVVADEGTMRLGSKPRIPDVCKDSKYAVVCARALDMFEREGWQFWRPRNRS